MNLPAALSNPAPHAPRNDRWSKARPFLGRVVELEGLCTLTAADDKDTVRVGTGLTCVHATLLQR